MVYDISGNGRRTVRAGYGLYFASLTNATLLAATQLYGFGAIVYRAHDMTRIDVNLDLQGAPMRALYHDYGAAGGHYDTLEQAPRSGGARVRGAADRRTGGTLLYKPPPEPKTLGSARLMTEKEELESAARQLADPNTPLAIKTLLVAHYNLPMPAVVAPAVVAPAEPAPAVVAPAVVVPAEPAPAVVAPAEPAHLPIVFSEDEGQADMLHEALALGAAQPFNGGLNNGLMPDAPSPAPGQQPEPPSGFNPDEFFDGSL
jgi:hypothetical protein